MTKKLLIAGSVIVAASLDDVIGMFRTNMRPFGLIAVGLLVAGIVFTVAQVIRPAAYSSRAEIDQNFREYRDDRSYESWWPVWADKDAFANRELVSRHSRQIELVEWTSKRREIVVGAGAAEQVRIATFYYPFWTAMINDKKVDIATADDGTILIPVPRERSSVQLSFVEPAYNTIARYFSLVTWMILLISFAILRGLRFRSQRSLTSLVI